ncbi:MAG: hypothetical protein DRJ31_07965 [Candidatus Methanomethylicota archaeon]|uniref:Toprim domain-containing protein n=1 Tax=Thermoproteota archaeon TaxID=2056631 RepID=A0A497ENT7_9CREN|nr:MAG: hypothetical protein DRJ31_07965 [Candidatus Verstraetearchaeota archaeon]RLE53656.1 MAG: hypothetical protein DRJ33_00365 [Candidatus Verstraetearchaeota archaeon]
MKRLDEAFKGVKEVIEWLNENIDLVVVEGPHDSKALKLLGLSKPIVELSRAKKPLFEVIDWIVERFRRKRVALLLDFDEEGEKLSARLINELSQQGVVVSMDVRKRLRDILSSVGIKSIEGISVIKREVLEGRG